MDLLPSYEGLRDNLWSGVIEWLLFIAWGVLMAWLIRQWYRVTYYFAPPVLVLFVMVIVGLTAWTVNQVRDFYYGPSAPVVVVPPFILPSSPITEPVVTLSTPSEEMKGIIRHWLDDFHFQVLTNAESGELYFSFVVQGGVQGIINTRITILRQKKERENFIQFFGLVNFDDGDQEKVKSLPLSDQQRIVIEIGAELKRQKIATRIQLLLKSVTVETRIAIAELTQAKLVEKIDEIDYAVGLTVLKIRSLLDYDYGTYRKAVIPDRKKSLSVTSSRRLKRPR